MLFRNVQKLLKQNSQLRLFAMKSSTSFGSRLAVFTTSFVGALLKSVRMLSLTRFRNCMTTSSSKVHHTMEKNIIYVLS